MKSTTTLDERINFEDITPPSPLFTNTIPPLCDSNISPDVPSPALSIQEIKDVRSPLKEDCSSCESLPLTPYSYDTDLVVHDRTHYMFKICLDTKGNTAALCYLPTRFPTIVEFYHTEIPMTYRNMGIGDIILKRAFEWVQQLNLLIIPTCPFVKKYLQTHSPKTTSDSGLWKFVMESDHCGY
ncbi:hypothetical protein DM01DRAFT_1332831 [Hesseltinella vesiculosa]|uniref:N-acetyltransferase domain-containing protein n=1 Tax=Hesseltinella vesiculosa TaxID=101127 RepID=A0A1X2GTB9_9FUNG|nr:hypothetical protein DM01DRAFT_1332831 [Hesseltinella vesiculosa]